jgi:hypothetical protein
MQRQGTRTLILGSGPVGLIAALASARQGPTTLSVHRWPPHTLRPRIEVIPAPLLALLLEFGVNPAELGVDELHDARLIAWESAVPSLQRGPACAHIERGALERTLQEAVARDSRIRVSTPIGRAPWAAVDRVFDATGRLAVTAAKRVDPARCWRTLIFAGETSRSRALSAFRIAALPDGYAYRLGSGRQVVLGIAGPTTRRSAEHVEAHLRANGAAWLLAGLPPLAALRPGRGGISNAAWTEEWGRAICLGDAALARDALASQGLAVGISDALQLATGNGPFADAWAQRTKQARIDHARTLLDILARGRFRQESAWIEYARFLADAAGRIEALPEAR